MPAQDLVVRLVLDLALAFALHVQVLVPVVFAEQALVLVFVQALVDALAEPTLGFLALALQLLVVSFVVI